MLYVAARHVLPIRHVSFTRDYCHSEYRMVLRAMPRGRNWGGAGV
jgi:hypothetical protein